MRAAFCVLIALGLLRGSESMTAEPVTTCDVGEQEPAPTGEGWCNNGDDDSACQEYCSGKFGSEAVGALCESRPNNKRECICQLKCCNSGCWGEPHCWTCDGLRFGYQGLKKHYLIKPIKSYPTLPYFEIRQINKKFVDRSFLTVADVVEVVIKDWSLTIQVKLPDAKNLTDYVLTVNDKQERIPYRFSQFEEYREHFVTVLPLPGAKNHVVLTTSFGLRITFATRNKGNGVSIDTPRHPELKDNSHGLLGRWNDNPDDDAIDATGVKQPVDEKFSWTFGDSWIVPGGRLPTPQCVRDEAVLTNQQNVENTPPEVKEEAENLCRRALENQELIDCARKIGRVVPLVKNCIMDLILLDESSDRKTYIDELVGSFTVICNAVDIENPNILTDEELEDRPQVLPSEPAPAPAPQPGPAVVRPVIRPVVVPIVPIRPIFGLGSLRPLRPIRPIIRPVVVPIPVPAVNRPVVQPRPAPAPAPQVNRPGGFLFGGLVVNRVPVIVPQARPVPQPVRPALIPQRVPQPAPRPAPQPAPRPAPQPAPRPAPQPAPRPAARPAVQARPAGGPNWGGIRIPQAGWAGWVRKD